MTWLINHFDKTKLFTNLYKNLISIHETIPMSCDKIWLDVKIFHYSIQTSRGVIPISLHVLLMEPISYHTHKSGCQPSLESHISSVDKQ